MLENNGRMYRKLGKSIFDLSLALFLGVLLSPLIIFLFIFASVDTQSFGIFKQLRIGRYGMPFTIFKIKTIHPDTRTISLLGRFLRRSKLDELPQIFNILKGEMSFVGPRPDIKGYYDTLSGEDRRILSLKPGLTSEAGIKYCREKEILENQNNPLVYNDTVIFPDKIRMNLKYLEQQSFAYDLKIMIKTVLVLFRSWFD